MGDTVHYITRSNKDHFHAATLDAAKEIVRDIRERIARIKRIDPSLADAMFTLSVYSPRPTSFIVDSPILQQHEKACVALLRSKRKSDS
jgi:hypothetical protein